MKTYEKFLVESELAEPEAPVKPVKSEKASEPTTETDTVTSEKPETDNTTKEPTKQIVFDETKYKNIFSSVQNFWKKFVYTKRNMEFNRDTEEQLNYKLKSEKYVDFKEQINSELQKRVKEKNDKIERVVGAFTTSFNKKSAESKRQIITDIVNKHPKFSDGTIYKFVMHPEQLEKYEKENSGKSVEKSKESTDSSTTTTTTTGGLTTTTTTTATNVGSTTTTTTIKPAGTRLSLL